MKYVMLILVSLSLSACIVAPGGHGGGYGHGPMFWHR